MVVLTRDSIALPDHAAWETAPDLRSSCRRPFMFLLFWRLVIRAADCDPTPRRRPHADAGSSASPPAPAPTRWTRRCWKSKGVGLEIRPRLVGALHQPYGADLKELIRRVSGPGPCEAREVGSAAPPARRELRRRRPRRRRPGQPQPARGAGDRLPRPHRLARHRGPLPFHAAPGHGRRRGGALRRHHGRATSAAATWRPAARGCRWPP